jgi:hypothetical protein
MGQATFVQNAVTSTSYQSTSFTQSLSGVVAGDAFILYVISTARTSAPAAALVTSTGSPVWNSLGTIGSGGPGAIDIWWTPSGSPGGSITITITPNGIPTPQLIGCYAEEWNLSPSTSSWVIHAASNNAGATGNPTLTLTPRQSTDLVTVFFSAVAGITASPASPWVDNAGPVSGLSGEAYLNATSSSSQSATWTSAGSAAWETLGVVISDGFTNPHSYVGTVTSGNTVTTTITVPPLAGQLIWASIRVPTLTSPSTPPTVQALNSGSGLVQNLIPIGVPAQVAAAIYEQVYYAVAVGTEASLSCTWTGTAAAAAPGQAILEYDEFDGFAGLPTLDISAEAQSGGAATSVSASGAKRAKATPELAICSAAIGNTSGAWKLSTSTYNSVAFQAFTQGTSSGYLNTAWLDYTGTAPLNPVFQMAWTTSRSSSVFGATFFDQTWVNGQVRLPA